jgi:hypothetical protein
MTATTVQTEPEYAYPEWYEQLWAIGAKFAKHDYDQELANVYLDNLSHEDHETVLSHLLNERLTGLVFNDCALDQQQTGGYVAAAQATNVITAEIVAQNNVYPTLRQLILCFLRERKGGLRRVNTKV